MCMVFYQTSKKPEEISFFVKIVQPLLSVPVYPNLFGSLLCFTIVLKLNLYNHVLFR